MRIDTKRVMILEKNGKFFLCLGKDREVSPDDFPEGYEPDEWWEEWGPSVSEWAMIRAQLDLIFGGGNA